MLRSLRRLWEHCVGISSHTTDAEHAEATATARRNPGESMFHFSEAVVTAMASSTDVTCAT